MKARASRVPKGLGVRPPAAAPTPPGTCGRRESEGEVYPICVKCNLSRHHRLLPPHAPRTPTHLGGSGSSGPPVAALRSMPARACAASPVVMLELPVAAAGEGKGPGGGAQQCQAGRRFVPRGFSALSPSRCLPKWTCRDCSARSTPKPSPACALKC